MHCASKTHFQAAKRIFRYIKGTIDYEIIFSQVEKLNLHGYSDSDWAGNINDMSFNFGSSVFYGAQRNKKL
jgi:hypothetical protein